jgi:[NiFe] hydrogenase diaphorase moiety large subunit
MSPGVKALVSESCQTVGRDRTRLMDVVRAIQREQGCVSGEAMDLIAEELGIHRVEVESAVSFYDFLSERPKGKVVIRVCNDVVDRMQGADAVVEAFSEALGIPVGETTPDGAITLETTACIGMCDQAPAALANDEVLTDLDPHKARKIVAELRQHLDPNRLVTKFGDGNNAHELVTAAVRNNLCQAGPVVFAEATPGAALHKALAMTPQEVIRV